MSQASKALETIREGQTPGEALRVATQRLASTGCTTPRSDAKVLIAMAAGVDPESVADAGHRELSASAANRARDIVDRRSRREPLSIW